MPHFNTPRNARRRVPPLAPLLCARCPLAFVGRGFALLRVRATVAGTRVGEIRLEDVLAWVCHERHGSLADDGVCEEQTAHQLEALAVPSMRRDDASARDPLSDKLGLHMKH